MFKRFTLRKGKTLLKALKSGGVASYFSFMGHHLSKGLESILKSFYLEMREVDFAAPLEDKNRQTLKGLHQLISKHSFSIVVFSDSDVSETLKKTLQAAFAQTTPRLEVILFGAGDQEPLKALFPNLKVHEPPSGDYVLSLFETEVIRSDLLYRYEQLLLSKPQTKALFSGAAGLDKGGKLLPGTLYIPPKKLNFPYEFQSLRAYGLMTSIEVWEKGITLEKLDVKGVKPIFVPLPLVGKLEQKETLPFTEEKKEYFKAKGLDWSVDTGLLPNVVKATPKLKHEVLIQVVMPFKDAKAITLQAAGAALASKGVKVHLTAIDNRSQDLSIAEELKLMGCEVMLIDEPFNYSRLNNLGVKNTEKPCPLICFLNNDAILEPDALLEMSRWAYQSDLGLVGCRLHYPNGLIQHAGVHIEPEKAYPGSVCWSHVEMKESFEKSRLAKTLHVPDAVTAAAAVIERVKFEKVGGFDELLYPIAYSDTDLCRRLNDQGFKPFYTPYAVGVHFESLSREPGFLEDFDRSKFLSQFSESLEFN